MEKLKELKINLPRDFKIKKIVFQKIIFNFNFPILYNIFSTCEYPACERNSYNCGIMNCGLCKIHCDWGLSS